MACRKALFFCTVKESFQISEAERHAPCDALSRVACHEHPVGLLSQAYQQEQFSCGEVLRLVNIYLPNAMLFIIISVITINHYLDS